MPLAGSGIVSIIVDDAALVCDLANRDLTMLAADGGHADFGSNARAVFTPCVVEIDRESAGARLAKTVTRRVDLLSPMRAGRRKPAGRALALCRGFSVAGMAYWSLLHAVARGWRSGEISTI